MLRKIKKRAIYASIFMLLSIFAILPLHSSGQDNASNSGWWNTAKQYSPYASYLPAAALAGWGLYNAALQPGFRSEAAIGAGVLAAPTLAVLGRHMQRYLAQRDDQIKPFSTLSSNYWNIPLAMSIPALFALQAWVNRGENLADGMSVAAMFSLPALLAGAIGANFEQRSDEHNEKKLPLKLLRVEEKNDQKRELALRESQKPGHEKQKEQQAPEANIVESRKTKKLLKDALIKNLQDGNKDNKISNDRNIVIAAIAYRQKNQSSGAHSDKVLNRIIENVVMQYMLDKNIIAKKDDESYEVINIPAFNILYYKLPEEIAEYILLKAPGVEVLPEELSGLEDVQDVALSPEELSDGE